MKNAKKLLAFRLRLQGYSYKTIAEKTGWSEFTLRKYFSRKGKWFHEYKQWSTTELEQIHDDMHTMLVSQAMSAAKKIAGMLESDKPSIALRAAQDILDRAGFQKNSGGFQSGEDAVDYAEEIIMKIEAHKASKNGYENETNNSQGK